LLYKRKLFGHPQNDITLTLLWWRDTVEIHHIAGNTSSEKVAAPKKAAPKKASA
jgi:hypothetical protein